MPIAEIRRLETLDLPELAPYRTLRRYAEHIRDGIFVAEGDKVVRRLIESEFGMVSALLSEEAWAVFEPLLQVRPDPITVYLAPKKVMEELVGFPLFQGVLAVGRIPPRRALAEVVACSARPRLFVAVDGLTNADNLGVVARNCAGFGVHGLITGDGCTSPFLRRAVRNSMGGIFKLPVIEGVRLIDALRLLRAASIRCVAAHPHADRRTLWETSVVGDSCLVFGSEGYGISSEVLAECDEQVAIPMSNEVDSLNVSCASAAFLAETQRQRRAPAR